MDLLCVKHRVGVTDRAKTTKFNLSGRETQERTNKCLGEKITPERHKEGAQNLRGRRLY